MRNIGTLFLFSVIMIAGCNNAGDSGQTSGDTAGARQDTVNKAGEQVVSRETVAGCYSQIYERDTSSLQVKLSSDSMTGPLVYKLFEKDRNDGMFKGELKNDLLSGWYYFKSEGIMSVREVVWRVNNGQLWPAMGEMKIRNDTMVFSDPTKLKYDSTHPFIKTNCTD